MSGHFDWRTDDGSWEQEPPETAAPRPKRHWLVGALVGVIALSLLGYFTLREIDARTNAVVELTTGNLNASFAQVFRADRERDPELLRDVLSGRDEAWAAAAQLNAELGTLYGREAWGWQQQGPPRIISQTLSSDLAEYDVHFELDYNVLDRDGSIRPVTVRHDARFRQGENNKWLLTPPPAGYWGATLRSSGNLMKANYPARDKAVAQNLAQQIERLVSSICNDLQAMVCSTEIDVIVTLSADLATLSDQLDARSQLDGTHLISLPAPSLFGQPTTAGGERLLVDTYLRAIAARVIGEQVGYHCCAQERLYRWLLQQQLGMLGLSPHPEAGGGLTSLDEIATAWPAGASASTNYSLLIDFLLARNDLATAELQRTLSREHDSLWAWLWTIEPKHQTPTGLARQYADFVAAAYGQPDRLRRDESLLLSCVDNRAAAVSLYSFNPHTNQLKNLLQPEQQADDKSALFNFVGQNANGSILLSSLTTDDSGTTMGTWIWQNGRLQPWPSLASSKQLLLAIRGDYAYSLQFHAAQVAFNTPPTGHLSQITDCEGSCSAPIAGPLVWSPNGHSAIVLQTDFNKVYADTFLQGVVAPVPFESYELTFVADPFGETQQLGPGSTPFWLDENRFAYVGPTPAGPALLTATTTEPQATAALVTLDDLAPALKYLPNVLHEADLSSFEIIAAMPNPADSQQFFLTVTQGERIGALGRDRRYLFLSYNLASGTPNYLFTETGDHFGMSISPRGDFVTVYNAIAADTFGRIFYHDVDAGTTLSQQRRDQALVNASQRFGNASGVWWSPSGDWVLSLVEGMRLWAPRTGEMLDVPYSHGNFYCYDAVWVESSETAAE